jgi:hypothetical protein
MEIDKLFNVDQVPDSLFDSVNNTVSEARALQKKKAAENAQAVIQALQKMKGDLEGKYDGIYSMLESRIASIQDGRDGIDGRDGRNGRDGKDGKDGVAGRDGRDGVDGINGLDGADGISIADIRVDFDNSLVITLSNGREINAGEILPPDISDRLKVIINQGANGAGGGGASLPDQSGNAGKFLTTNGSAASWGTPAGSGDVVGPASATANAIARFNSTTGKLIKNSGVTIDDNNNVTANNFLSGFLNTAASATQITLTLASVPSYVITGSGGQVIQLPNATTLANGATYKFNNNQSSGAITVNNNSGSLIVSVPSGGYVQLTLLSNAIAAGSWDRHDYAPANVAWSTNTFDYAGSITSATWNGVAVAVNRGGTGQSSFTDGQLLIGNSTGNTLTKATLTAGANITITNSAGGITIASSGGGGGSSAGNAYAWFVF